MGTIVITALIAEQTGDIMKIEELVETKSVLELTKMKRLLNQKISKGDEEARKNFMHESACIELAISIIKATQDKWWISQKPRREVTA